MSKINTKLFQTLKMYLLSTYLPIYPYFTQIQKVYKLDCKSL